MFYRIIRQCAFGPLIVNSVKVTFPAAYSFSVLIHSCFSLTHARVYWWKSVNLHLSDPRNNAAFISFDLWKSTSILSLPTTGQLSERNHRPRANLLKPELVFVAASVKRCFGRLKIHPGLFSQFTVTVNPNWLEKISRLWSPVRWYSWNPHPGPHLL